MRRSCVALGGGAGGFPVPRHFPKDTSEPKRVASGRMSDMHAVGEVPGSGFAELRGEIGRRINQHPDKKMEGRSSRIHSHPLNFRSQEQIPDMTHTIDADGSRVGFPYPAVYGGAFLFWMFWFVIEAETGPRTKYMIPDPDCDRPELRYFKLSPKKYGMEPFLNDNNPVTGHLCEVRPLPCREAYVPMGAVPAPH